MSVRFQVPTGSMSGLILNDQVEAYHVLRPNVRASGRVVRAHQLDCIIEVVEGKEKEKLQETLDTIYLVRSNCFLLHPLFLNQYWLFIPSLLSTCLLILLLLQYFRMKISAQKTGQLRFCAL